MFESRNQETDLTQQDTLEVEEKGRGGKPGREQKKPKGGQPRQEPRPDRQRWSDEVSETAVKNRLFQFQLRRFSSNVYDTGFPIDEVIESISAEQGSNNSQGGFASYWRMARAAKDGSLPQEDTTDFENLRNACAEAIIYKLVRESPATGDAPVTTTAIFDPIGKASSLKALLPDYAQPFTNKIIESVRGKTPDLLQVSTPFSYREPDGTLTTQSPGLANVVDPDDPTASRTKTEPYRFKTLIAPMEITLSENADNMLGKVKKAKTYRNPFKNSGNIEFVPVLVLDRQAFLSQSPEDRVKIVQKMKEAGGYIQLISNLRSNSATYAKLISLELVQAVQQANTKGLDFKQSTKEKSLSERLFAKPKEWLQSLTQKSPLSNRLEKPIQKESAAETYKRVASNIKSNPSFFQKIGVVNSDHIDLEIASNVIRSGLDPVELLKQSPTYQAKMPVLNKMWLNKIVHDAKGISEEAPNSANFQKAIKKYDDKKTKAQSNQKKATNASPTKRLASEVYQEMTSSLKETASYPQDAGIDVVNNSNHLDLMLAKQLMRKDIDYKTILKQSPNYRSKEPAEANSWLKNIIKDGISMSKEYYLDSDGSQKIIRSYDNDASRPPEKSDFENLSKSIQRYNSSHSTDRQGLLVAVAKTAIRAGMDPEQVLRQSPDYLLANSGKGEALVEKTVEKAESNIQEERSRAEQQSQRDNQRDRGREL
jgi:hypothetical protein